MHPRERVDTSWSEVLTWTEKTLQDRCHPSKSAETASTGTGSAVTGSMGTGAGRDDKSPILDHIPDLGFDPTESTTPPQCAAAFLQDLIRLSTHMIISVPIPGSCSDTKRACLRLFVDLATLSKRILPALGYKYWLLAKPMEVAHLPQADEAGDTKLPIITSESWKKSALGDDHDDAAIKKSIWDRFMKPRGYAAMCEWLRPADIHGIYIAEIHTRESHLDYPSAMVTDLLACF